MCENRCQNYGKFKVTQLFMRNSGLRCCSQCRHQDGCAELDSDIKLPVSEFEQGAALDGWTTGVPQFIRWSGSTPSYSTGEWVCARVGVYVCACTHVCASTHTHIHTHAQDPVHRRKPRTTCTQKPLGTMAKNFSWSEPSQISKLIVSRSNTICMVHAWEQLRDQA